LEDGIQIERLVSGAAESFAPGLQFGLLDVAGRRDDADRVPRTESGRFDELAVGG